MITTKVAFVLQLIDDFSGKLVGKKKFLFYRDGRQIKPIEKPEGLYVFLEPMGEKEQIFITGSDYHPCTVEIEKESLKNRDRIQNVRLYGKFGGSFPYKYSLLEGKVEAKKLTFPVEVCARKEKNTGLAYKEFRMLEDGPHLLVHGFTKEQLIGKTFALSNKKDLEVFVITEKLGMNEYRIEGKITGKYADKTPIERVYRSVTDQEGFYAIPIELGEAEQISEVRVLQKK